MLDLEPIIAASAAEIAIAAKNTKGHRLVNLVKDGDIYRCLSNQKVDGDFLLSAKGMDDQAVSIEWVEGTCYISGLNSNYETIFSASIHQDITAMNRVLHEKLTELKVGEEIVVDPFFIVGPPGTGKTNTISKLVEEAIAAKQKVLVVSPTNMAVENVFERLNFEKMGLNPGDALLTVSIENESLKKYAPSAVAENKLNPINDELELFEEAMVEILRMQRDADTFLAPFIEEEDSVSLALSNLSKDEGAAKNALKRAQANFDDLEDRLNKLNSNALLKSVASKVMGGKIAELEAGKLIAQSAIEFNTSEISKIQKEKGTLTTDRERISKKIEEARKSLSEAIASRTEVENRIAELKRHKQDIMDLNLFGTAKLVGATLVSAALNKKINDGEFDKIIVDEASMASLPALVLACKAVLIKNNLPTVEIKSFDNLYEAQITAVIKALGSQFVFVGDPKQLSPIAKTTEMRKSIFEIYGIEKLFEGELFSNAVLLDINFRNHPDIVDLSSRLFYGGMLKSGREHNGKKALFIRNIKGAFSSHEGSFVNHASANVVFEQTSLALEKGRRSIGVITPYREQAKNINNRMNDLRQIYLDADMQAGTVHRFQGKEKGVVMFDITASSGSALPATYAGDLKSEASRLLNVAMTRAEDFFVLIGDIDGLERQLVHTKGYESMALYQWIVGIKELAYSK